ncbi:MAG: biotin--[acetyl-CoA-carboxylase] ligase [Bacteroidales bacterium]|jgi:BirA family biotin operon repressor/biotin-[acetyl-CoA-carboxylase] ligase
MIGSHIIEIEETQSTNRYASELISTNGLEEGTVISAKFQYAGKGTGDNSWESEKGKNLLISIILKPEFLPLNRQFMLNVIASLGFYDMLKQLTGNNESIRIKWPNDVYAGNKKIAGMLVENAIMGDTFMYTILGIGININQEVFVSNAANPISLKNITGKDYNIQECLSLLCSKMDKRYIQLKEMHIDALTEEYISLLYRKSEEAKYIYKGQTISATIINISMEGKLILRTQQNKIVECDFKEVEFVI